MARFNFSNLLHRGSETQSASAPSVAPTDYHSSASSSISSLFLDRTSSYVANKPVAPPPRLRHTGRSDLFHPRRGLGRSNSEGVHRPDLRFDEVLREWRTIPLRQPGPPGEAGVLPLVEGGEQKKARRLDRFKKRAGAFVNKFKFSRKRNVGEEDGSEVLSPLQRARTSKT